MSFAADFIQSALKANSPDAQLEREVVMKHFDTQAKLANERVATSVQSIADKVEDLKSKLPSGQTTSVAIQCLERLMVNMSS